MWGGGAPAAVRIAISPHQVRIVIELLCSAKREYSCFGQKGDERSEEKRRRLGMRAVYNPCAAAWRPAKREKTTLRVCPVQDG